MPPLLKLPLKQPPSCPQLLGSQFPVGELSRVKQDAKQLADMLYLISLSKERTFILLQRRRSLWTFSLGTGSFGRVHLVRSRHNGRFYAVKVLNKEKVIKMKQVEHTNSEREMLVRVRHPFLVNLWGTFQDVNNLYMVMDFVAGGELFSLLRKSQVRCANVAHPQTINICGSDSRILSRNSTQPKLL